MNTATTAAWRTRRARCLQLRALPPPQDWPDGADGAVWREDLGCALRRVVALLPEHQVQLWLGSAFRSRT